MVLSEIIVESGGLNKTIDSSTSKAHQHDKEKERERARRYVNMKQSNSSGSQKFICSYKCRTDGFVLYDGTDRSKVEIQADKLYQARSKIEKIAKQDCKGRRGRTTGDYMWPYAERCEKKF
jgi:hypothetical protein